MTIFILQVFLAVTLTDGERTNSAEYQSAWVGAPYAPTEGMSLKDVSEFPLPLLHLSISEADKTQRAFDVITRVTFCSPMSGWICFKSSSQSFAIPKNITAATWAKAGVEYRLMGRSVIKVLGRSVEVLSIHARRHVPAEETAPEKFPSEIQNLIFYFSDVHGLVAFARADQLEPIDGASIHEGMYYSQSLCGFGALKGKCSELK